MTGVDHLGVVHGYKPNATRDYGVLGWGTYCGAWACEPKDTGDRVAVTCMTCLVNEAKSTR